MNIHNRRYDDPQHDCTWPLIIIIVVVALSLAYHEELWAGLDWVLTTTENFNGRHQ